MAALCEPIEFGDDPTALYHLYNVSDEVIYIGVTVAPAKRMEKHADESSWWPEVAKRTMVWYPTRDEACEAETAAIQAEKPKHNQKQRSNPNSVRPGRRVRADDAERAVAYETGLPVELFPGGPVRRRITAENAGMRWSA